MADTQALVVQRRTKFDEQLVKLTPRFTELLPARCSAKQFVQMCKLAALRNPGLLEPDVDRGSLVMAVLSFAETGLSPGPLAHLIPFRQGKVKVVVAVPDYKGLVDVALNSGKVSAFDIGCIYKNDRYKYVKGNNPVFEHEPVLVGDRGAFVAAYALAWPMALGMYPASKMMTREEIEIIRNGSKGYQYALANGKDNPWLDGKKPGEFKPGTPSAAMAMKTAVKQLWKVLPKSPEMVTVDRVDNESEAMTPQPVDDSIAELLGLERPDETGDMKAERAALLAKLVPAQQREPKLFASAAVGLNLDPKVKLETLSLDGLVALDEEIEAARAGGGE